MRQLKSAIIAPSIFILMLLLSIEAWAGMSIKNLTIRESHKVDSSYFEITNTSDKEDKLISVESSAYERVELHTMDMTDNIMRMRRLDSVTLPAGETVEFKRMGLHLMLFTPRDHDTKTFTFQFEDAETVTVNLK